ncbi:MAG: hypothetical protein WDW38_000717 [Sanguina aurantia]
MEDGGRHEAIPTAGAGLVRDHIYITEGNEQRTICVSATIPPDMMRTTPWRVEDFELHKELYRGKTSLLYQATDRKSGTMIALKLYRKRKLSTLNRYQVEREIRIHIALQHQHIIRLHVAFEDEKNVYMVQEFATGGDLFEDLKKGGGQMKEGPTATAILIPFLSSLAYLHGMGVVHRDIKPENILLTGAKILKVADFGLSINVRQERPVTRAGTLDYMAPEVLVCPDKRRPEENKDKLLLAYTAQVDSWAVGILAYELLVGYPPFEQESRAATYEHIMYKEPKFPAWMSDGARNFISVALCKNAAHRPTVYDLARHAWLVGQADGTATSPTPSAALGTARGSKGAPDASSSSAHAPHAPPPAHTTSGRPHHTPSPHSQDPSGVDGHEPTPLLPSLSPSSSASHQTQQQHSEQQQDQHPSPPLTIAVEPWGMPSPSPPPQPRPTPPAADPSPTHTPQHDGSHSPRAGGAGGGGGGGFSSSHSNGSPPHPASGGSPHTSYPDPTSHPYPLSSTFPQSIAQQAAAAAATAAAERRLIADSGDSFTSPSSTPNAWNQQQLQCQSQERDGTGPGGLPPAYRDSTSGTPGATGSSGASNRLNNTNAGAASNNPSTLKLPALPSTPRTHSERALSGMAHSGSSRDMTTPQPRGVLSDDTSLGSRASGPFSLSLEIGKLGPGLAALPGLGPASPSGLGGLGNISGRPHQLLKGNMNRPDSSASLSGTTCEVLDAGNGGCEGGGAGGYGHSYFEEGAAGGSAGGGNGGSSAEQQGKQSKYARLFGKLWGGGGKEQPADAAEPSPPLSASASMARQVSGSSRSFGGAASQYSRAASLSMTQRSGASGGGSSGTIGAGIMPRGKLVNGGVTLDAVPARESSYTTRSAGSGELPSPGSGGGVGFSKHSAGAAAMRRGVLDESLIAVGRVHSSTEAPPRGHGSMSGNFRGMLVATNSKKSMVQTPAITRVLE